MKKPRREMLKNVTRGGLLLGFAGIGTLLATRENKVRCTDQCNGCKSFKNGTCGLGLK